MSRIKVANVIITDDNRKQKNLDPLIESIKKVGLLNPITVTRKGVLISGYYRLQACKKLNWVEVPATFCNLDEIQQELAKIDENMLKNNLTVLEEATLLNRRKELYEILNPNSKPDLQRQKGLNVSADMMTALNKEKTYVKDVFEKIGKSQRTVRRYLEIGKNLSADIMTALKDTPIENNLTDLIILSKLKDQAQQKDLIEKVKSGEYKSINAAIKGKKSPEKGVNVELIDFKNKTVPYDKYYKLEMEHKKLKLKYEELELKYKESISVKPLFGWMK